MDSLKYQQELKLKWAELSTKISKDEEFISAGKARVKVSKEYWLTLNTKGLPGLQIFIDKKKQLDKNKIPDCKGWKIDISENVILMSLKDEDYRDFFKDIINLILTRIYLLKLHSDESIKFFFEKLISAKNFFDEESSPRKLTSESQTGLFGELTFLDEFIGKKYSKKDALSFWSGPTKQHDFTTNNILLETKTSKVVNQKKISVSSNHQLSPIFEKKLYLIFIQIEKNLNGKSLNKLIDDYSEKLKTESELLLNDFYIKLRQSGYYDIHRDHYKENYVLKNIFFYYISKSFPYIKDVSKPEAISELSITYKIDLDKCEEFRVNEEKMLAEL